MGGEENRTSNGSWGLIGAKEPNIHYYNMHL